MPTFGKAEINNLIKVIESGCFCDKAGGFMDQFRRNFATAQEAEHAIAGATAMLLMHAIPGAIGAGAGDEIIAVDGFRVDSANWKKRLQQYHPDDRVEVLIARRQKLMTLSLQFAGRPRDPWQLEADDQAGDRHRRNLSLWLQDGS